MKTFLAAAILSLLGSSFALADLKIGLVDTSKAFDAFYKTRETAVRIAAKEAKFKKEIEDVQGEYQQFSDEAQALANSVKDVSLPADVRKAKDGALALKVEDLKSLEDELTQMSKQRKDEINDELARSHEEIYEEIAHAVAAYGDKQGYDLILDSSSQSTAVDLSRIPYRSARVFDLTETIITKLNASAPASAQATSQ